MLYADTWQVFVAGGFNDWSDHATPLQKNADGSFAAEVPLPWGQKQAFKYVVDGEWKVREDEAKEWGESSGPCRRSPGADSG